MTFWSRARAFAGGSYRCLYAKQHREPLWPEHSSPGKGLRVVA